MIPFDFDYYRPETLNEAHEIYNQLFTSGKKPIFYGGGTEIISMARAGSIEFGAVIDLKGISECLYFGFDEENLIIGSMVTLTQIAESGCFPLLGETVSRIADHTIQGKITIGGNLAGTIIYREAALPLMITDSKVKIMKEGGLVVIPFLEIFDGRLKLQNGEFLVQILINKSYLKLPYNHVKKTKMTKIDYPLITLDAIKKEGIINAAASGLSQNPFLLPKEILNDKSVSKTKRIDNTINAVQNNIISDLSGSKEYRIFVLKNVLSQMLCNFNEE